MCVFVNYLILRRSYLSVLFLDIKLEFIFDQYHILVVVYILFLLLAVLQELMYVMLELFPEEIVYSK